MLVSRKLMNLICVVDIPLGAARFNLKIALIVGSVEGLISFLYRPAHKQSEKQANISLRERDMYSKHIKEKIYMLRKVCER